MPYCGKCGAKVSENANFCEQCGLKLPEIPNNTRSASAAPPETRIDVVKEPAPEQSEQHETEAEPVKEADGDLEELDLTALDKKAKEQPHTDKTTAASTSPAPVQKPVPKKPDNIINIQDVLESEEKVKADDSIKREVLADDEVLTKVCPMCGEDLQLNRKLLENAPVLVKCLKCGNETKIW